MSEANEYVLTTTDEELQRLGLQHQLWRGQAYAIWERAGIGPGKRVLDVGCGPGFATFDLAQLVGTSGHVSGFDISEKFVNHVRALSQQRGVTNVDATVADVQKLKVQSNSFDAAYTRWVLCFVPDPQKVIDAVAAALRIGGTFAIQDYYHYGAAKLAPSSTSFDHAVRQVYKSWKDHGGDPEVGCRLPTMLANAGFEVTYLAPVVRLGRPHDPIWNWPTTFFKVFVPELIKTGYMTEPDAAEFFKDWQAHTSNPNAFFTSPPMVDVVATKR